MLAWVKVGLPAPNACEVFRDATDSAILNPPSYGPLSSQA
jgi:hypothetical protein